MSKRFSLAVMGAIGLAATPLSLAAEHSVLQEVVVTAQKVKQTIEQVPVAVSVVGADTISKENISGVAGLQNLVPDLHVAQSPFQPVVEIRGVGSGGGNRTFDESVAMYVNGVYAGRANQFLYPFFDVKRVEVVRGPQGVLFGVNAVSGGINIVDQEPSNRFGGYVATGYELDNKSYHVDGAVNVPLGHRFAVRLAGTKGNDGPYLRNDVPGGPNLETAYDLFRGIAKWQPFDSLVIKLSVESSKRNQEGSPFEMYALGTDTLPVYGYSIDTNLENGVLDFRRSSADRNEHTNIQTHSTTLNVTWVLGANTITSVTGYSTYAFNQAVAAAPIPESLGDALAQESFSQTYQELRLSSAGKRRIDYLLGAVYYRQNDDLYQGVNLGIPAGLVGFRNGLVEGTRTYAVYGQLTYNFTPSFRAIGGLRYSDVQTDGNYTLGAATFGAPISGYAFSPAAAIAISGFPPLGWLQFINPADPAPQTRSQVIDLRKVDPSFSLQGDVNAHIHPYFTFTTATKAGGFDDQEKSGVIPLAYRPESAKGYEVGVKLKYSRLRVDADVFDTKFRDLQVTLQSGNNVLTSNAASVTSKGFELNGIYLLTDNIRVGGDLTYLDARYDNFSGVGCVIPLNALQAVLHPCDGSLTNAAGRRVENSPRLTTSAHLDGAHAIMGSLMLEWGGRVYYNSGYSLQPNGDPIDVQGGYTTFNAYLGVEGGDSSTWELRVVGKNLGNKAILLFGGYAGLGAGHAGMVGPGREIWVDTRWKF